MLEVIEAKRALARVPDLGFGPPQKPKDLKKSRRARRKNIAMRAVSTIKTIKIKLRVDSID